MGSSDFVQPSHSSETTWTDNTSVVSSTRCRLADGSDTDACILGEAGLLTPADTEPLLGSADSPTASSIRRGTTSRMMSAKSSDANSAGLHKLRGPLLFPILLLTGPYVDGSLVVEDLGMSSSGVSSCITSDLSPAGFPSSLCSVASPAVSACSLFAAGLAACCIGSPTPSGGESPLSSGVASVG